MMLCVEVEECRLSRLVASPDRTIRACLEYQYIPTDSDKENEGNRKNEGDADKTTKAASDKKKLYRSRDEVVEPGATMLVPQRGIGLHLVVKFFYLSQDTSESGYQIHADGGDEADTRAHTRHPSSSSSGNAGAGAGGGRHIEIIGKSVLDGGDLLRRLVNPGSRVDVTAEVVARSALRPEGLRVGRLSCRVSLRRHAQSFPGPTRAGAGAATTAHSTHIPRGVGAASRGASRLLTAAAGQPQPFPFFEFQSLDKPVDWTPLDLHVDVDQLLEQEQGGASGVKDLLTYGKYLPVGATFEGRGDGPIRGALQMQQLQLQYISYCCDTLRSREDTIADALRSFALEEEGLDSSIARLQARVRNLQKEARSLDRAHDRYAALLGDKSKALLAGAMAKLSREEQEAADEESAGSKQRRREGKDKAEAEVAYSVSDYKRMHPPQTAVRRPPSAAAASSSGSARLPAPAASTSTAANSSAAGANELSRGSQRTSDSDSDDDAESDVLAIVAERKAQGQARVSGGNADREWAEAGPHSRNPKATRAVGAGDSGEQGSGSSSGSGSAEDAIDERDEVPIPLSWLPPKHDGAAETAFGFARNNGNGNSNSNSNTMWVSAGVRGSLGSTNMSQDSLNSNALARPQTAQSAMSTDSLVIPRGAAKNGEGEDEGEGEGGGQGEEGRRRGISPRAPQVTKIVREWQHDGDAASASESEDSEDAGPAVGDRKGKGPVPVPLLGVSGGRGSSFGRGRDDDDEDPSMVNANVTLGGADQSSLMQVPPPPDGNDDDDKAGQEDPWQDVTKSQISISRPGVDRSQSSESPSSAASAKEDAWTDKSAEAPAKTAGQGGNKKIAANAFAPDDYYDDSAFDVSIDNEQDLSPGFAADGAADSVVAESKSPSQSYERDRNRSREREISISHISSPSLRGGDRSTSDSSVEAVISKFNAGEGRERGGGGGGGDKDWKGAYSPQNVQQQRSPDVLEVSYTEDNVMSLVEHKQPQQSISRHASPALPLPGAKLTPGRLGEGVGYRSRGGGGGGSGFNSADTSYDGKAAALSEYASASMDEYMGTGTGMGTPMGSQPGSRPGSRPGSYEKDKDKDSQQRLGLGRMVHGPASTHSLEYTVDSSVRDFSPDFRDESKDSPSFTAAAAAATDVPRYTRRSTKESPGAHNSDRKVPRPYSGSNEGDSQAERPGMRTQVLRQLFADSKNSDSSPEVSYAEDFSPEGPGGGGAYDDVLLGTVTVQPGELQCGQAKSDAAAGPAYNYNSVGHLKSLLGTSMDNGSSSSGKAASAAAADPFAVDSVAPSKTALVSAQRVWSAGRATNDTLDSGTCLDVLVSAIQLNKQVFRNCRTEAINLQLSFLGQLSIKSAHFDLKRAVGTGDHLLLPLQYGQHVNADDVDTSALRKEIETEEEGLCVCAFVRDASTGENIGCANINLWMMVEDATNIIRQEVNVYSLPSRNGLEEGVLMGSIYVDVRGYRLLLNHYSP